MPSYSAWNEDDDDRDWEAGDVDEDAIDHEDEPATFPCPGCSRQIYEEADACPHCGEYLADSDRSPAGKPLWMWAGVLLCIALTLSGLLVTIAFWLMS